MDMTMDDYNATCGLCETHFDEIDALGGRRFVVSFAVMLLQYIMTNDDFRDRLYDKACELGLDPENPPDKIYISVGPPCCLVGRDAFAHIKKAVAGSLN